MSSDVLVAVARGQLFRSLSSSTPPHLRWLDHVRRGSGCPDLQWSEIAVSRSAYAELREAVKVWLRARGRAAEIDDFNVPGISAPVISARVPFGFALVAREVCA